MTTAEFMVGAGSRLEIVTPERVLAPEVGGTNYPAYFKAISAADAKITLNFASSGCRARAISSWRISSTTIAVVPRTAAPTRS